MRMQTRRSSLPALALLALWGAAAVAQESKPVQPSTCSVESVVESVRTGLKTGSPAFKRYVRSVLVEGAIAMPWEQLRAAFERERDPAVVEALGAAMASRAARTSDPRPIQPVLQRAAQDPDPAARAAAVRGLRATGSVENMEKLREINYAQLIRDTAPEVREAVVGNLVTESAQVYSGHSREVSEMAVAAAVASPDPEAAAKLLGEVSMEQVSPAAERTVEDQLRSDSAKVRAGAATALGGVPVDGAASARSTLEASYRSEPDPTVRKAILESLVRLGFQGARPTLESLRGVDPSMVPEIDAWNTALKTNLQEWYLLKREKERIRR